jgi:hypothetical protein
MNALSGWENFYVIAGSSTGALIGLQFVALTLIAQRPARDPQPLQIASSTFATPTVLHFSTVLLVSGMLSAPWPAVTNAAIGWGIVGACGVFYELIVLRRMTMQTSYQPQLEDWIFHIVVPLAAYATLAVSAFFARTHAGGALFAVAGSVLGLLFTGIHNAWDAVTYHIFTIRPREHEKSGAEEQF